MKLRFRWLLMTVHSTLLLCGWAPVFAQSISPSGSQLSGVLVSEDDASLVGMQVEVHVSGSPQAIRGDVRPDGTFLIATAEAPGEQYILEVSNQSGQLVYRDVVRPAPVPLEIHLKTRHRERPVEGVISLEQLRNEVPPKALREFFRAQQAVEKGDVQRAIRCLGKAVKIHPTFVEAHNSLGVKYMMLGDYAQAAAAFEETVRLRPDTSQGLSNLGMALHGLWQYGEAERCLRRAIELDPTATKARYGLALVLISVGEKHQEALTILAEVAGQFPQAHLPAAAVLARQGDLRSAVSELQAYLDSGQQAERQRAEAWLRSLQPLATHP